MSVETETQEFPKSPARRMDLEGTAQDRPPTQVDDGSSKHSQDGGFNKVKRSQIVVGTNAVSRQLERDGLRAGVVCPSARPPLMHRHLLMMSASRDVPFAAVPRLSESVAPLLGLRTALAIGLKVRTGRIPEPENVTYFDMFDNLQRLRLGSIQLKCSLTLYF